MCKCVSKKLDFKDFKGDEYKMTEFSFLGGLILQTSYECSLHLLVCS